RDVFRRVWRVFRVNRAAVDIVRHFVPRIFQHLAFGGGVQKVRVGRERAFAALVLGDRDLVLFSPGDQRGAAGQIPFAPWSNNLDIRCQGIGAQFKTNLIVALAGGAVGNGVSAGFAGDFDQTLGNQRAGNGGAQQVIAFITRIG